MKVQLDNKVMSSMLLYVDHKVCKIGEAYTNHSRYLYETTPKYLAKDGTSNFFIYSAPHKQLVADHSITGAFVSSGMYFGTTLGDTHYGATGVIPRQSAQYSVKDFNVYLTTMSEQSLLFETKIELRPKITNPTTGLSPHAQTYPAIFVKNMGSRNEPFAFGGMDDTRYNVRTIVLSDSAFKLDAVCSILKDCVRDIIPLLDNSNLPFDAIGGSPSGYNYTGIAAGAINSGLYLNINDVVVSRGVNNAYSESKNPKIQASFVDFDLSLYRHPKEDNPRVI